MSYSYANERPQLFTERGVETLTLVRRNVERALKAAGAVRSDKAMTGAIGNSWTALAALDYMVEKGELREITDPEKVWAQHRVFVAGGAS